MAYQEIKAPPLLQPYIHSFWTISGLPDYEEHRVLPDGCSDIIFNLGTADCSVPKESIGISGMMTTFLDVSLNSSTELIGVRFRAGQLRNLTKTPLSTMKNKTVSASDIIPICNTELLEKIAEPQKLSQRLQIIEKTLFHIFSNQNQILEPIIASVLFYIKNSSGLIDSLTLAENHCISLRQLERKFKEQVGVTIKEYSRIIRFQNTSRYIQNNSDTSLAEIAFQCGYYDHSHLTNEFKKFTGETPSLLK